MRLRFTGLPARAALAAAALILVALTPNLAGCGRRPGAPPPMARRPARAGTGPSAAARAEITHEYAPMPAPQQTVPASAPSPAQAVRAFAAGYINWNANTVAARLEELSTVSVGQARAAMQLQAAQAASDPELRRGGIANHGRVQAVAPLAGDQSGRRWIVVTLERTTATLTDALRDLRPAWHITEATVIQLAPGAWVVSGWHPES